jgi:hypothetical protein
MKNPDDQNDSENSAAQPGDYPIINQRSGLHNPDTEPDSRDEPYNRGDDCFGVAGIILIATYNGIPSSLPIEFLGLEGPLFLGTHEAIPTERQRFFENHPGSLELAALRTQEKFASDVVTFLSDERRDYGWTIADSSELEQVLAPGWQKRLADWMCDGPAQNARQFEARSERQDAIRTFTEGLLGPCGSRTAAFEFIAKQWEFSAKVMAFFWPKIEQIVDVLLRGAADERTELESLLADVINRRFTLEPDEI